MPYYEDPDTDYSFDLTFHCLSCFFDICCSLDITIVSLLLCRLSNDTPLFTVLRHDLEQNGVSVWEYGHFALGILSAYCYNL